ncbi:AbrB/MazE/SpoVT family DNA-binding domain-containing protein [Halosimplex litoreum]|uniref:AbrB/MazE/SpoVT family DNA-binding domain-containing protein n=1 Tax=Halosimplex litoreum TaxID=1198301 RepID=A0A7T3FYC4_9EURY|nr:AbrB/MazE/SpoVT family DNA-binding domain-containing protein [Halosimplex litoreum]QPV62896.1 AbrB/MazE/SpoVT family DNA-binding domain-containing protein [Halosimplex litoreum]
MATREDATITSKGQVTIPKEIRERLDLDEGTKVEFVLDDDGRVTIRPKESAMERLRGVRRTLSKHDVDLDEMRRDSERAWSSHTEDS